MQFKKILEPVLTSMNIVEKVIGRDIFLLLGESQIGKSTTINFIRRVLFGWEKNSSDHSKPDLIPVSNPFNVTLAEMGDGIQRKTEKPEVYEGFPGFLIVDTRGVGQLGNDQSGKISASILMEMICRAARSVRIVAIVSFDQIRRVQALRSLMKQIGNLLPDPSSDIYWLVNRHHFNGRGSSPLTEDLETKIIEDISFEINTIWEKVKNIQIPENDSESTSISKAEIITLIAIREALKAEPRRIGYVDPTSEWSAWQIRGQITRIPSIPISNIKFGRENPHRPLFDNQLRQILDRETMFLITYRMLLEIDPKSIMEVEKMNEMIQDVKTKAIRIEEIAEDVKKLDLDMKSMREKEEIVHTATFCDLSDFWYWWRTTSVRMPNHLRHIRVSRWSSHIEKGTREEGSYWEGHPPSPVVRFWSPPWTARRGRVQFYAIGADIPAIKARLEQQGRFRDILIHERQDLIETSKSQKAEIEVRKQGILTTANAHKQIMSVMNETRRGQLAEYEQLVIRLWNPSPSQGTGIQEVDDFLMAMRTHRRIEAKHRKLHSLPIGDISKLASYSRAWMDNNEPVDVQFTEL